MVKSKKNKILVKWPHWTQPMDIKADAVHHDIESYIEAYIIKGNQLPEGESFYWSEINEEI